MPLARLTSSSTMRTLATSRGLGPGRRGVHHPGERHREGRAAFRAAAVRGDGAAVALHHRLHDEEPEAGAGVAAADLGADAVEAIEDEAQVRAAHPDAVVLDPQLGLAV